MRTNRHHSVIDEIKVIIDRAEMTLGWTFCWFSVASVISAVNPDFWCEEDALFRWIKFLETGKAFEPRRPQSGRAAADEHLLIF